MSPEDPNNPGLNTKNPDLSSVPLPEPAPIKSPYAPVGGTLGDVADDVAKNDPEATAAINPEAPNEPTFPTAGILTTEKESEMAANIPMKDADPSTTIAGTNANLTASVKKSKRSLFIICGAVLVVVVIVGLVMILGKGGGGILGGGGNGGNETKSAALYGSKSMMVSSVAEDTKTTKYAIYTKEGEKVTDFKYDEATDFLAGVSLVEYDDKYALVGEDGNEIVKAGEYKITAYGGLYGAENDTGKVLLNNKGEKVLEYTDEFGNYGDLTGDKSSAYTLFRAGNKLYKIYNTFGSAVTEFTSEIEPTISTVAGANVDETNTVVVYSGGVILLDSNGKESRRVSESISKKFFGIFVSRSTNIIGLSTTNQALVESLGSVHVPNDDRENALIINDKFYGYKTRDCAGLYYDDSMSGDDDGFVVCLTKNDSYIVKYDGELSDYAYSSAAKTYGSSGTDYPIAFNSYLTKTGTNDRGYDYAIFGDSGKKIANYALPKKTTDQDKSSNKTIIKQTFYNAMGMYDNYIIQRVDEQRVYQGGASTTTQTATVSIYDKKAKEICTIKGQNLAITTSTKNMFSNTLSNVSSLNSNFYGFSSGFALAKKADGDFNNMALLNDKCEVVEDGGYVSMMASYGLTKLVKKEGNKYIHTLYDKEGKVIDKVESSGSSVGGFTKYTNDIQLYNNGTDKKTLFIDGKKVKEFEHFCTFQSGVTYNDYYVEIEPGPPSDLCSDKEAIAGQHYYFLRKDGKQFLFVEEKRLK